MTGAIAAVNHQHVSYAAELTTSPGGLRAAAFLSCRRAALLGGAAALLAIAQAVWPRARLFVCPLRAVTGVPCPLCGGTTAAVSLAHGDLAGALAANSVVVLGAALLVVAPLALALGVRSPPARLRLMTAWLALVLSEVWQLARFEHLPF